MKLLTVTRNYKGGFPKWEYFLGGPHSKSLVGGEGLICLAQCKPGMIRLNFMNWTSEGRLLNLN